MKARFTFLLLSVAIIGLLAVCAVFTMRILDDEAAGTGAEPVKPSRPDNVSITYEENIVLPDGNDASTPSSHARKAVKRPTGLHAEEKQESDKAAPPPDFAGTVTELTGEAYLTSGDNGSRTKLSHKDRIHKGDSLETGSDTRLVIVFVDGTQLSLGEKTSCVIDEYVYDTSRKEKSGFGMRMVKGVCRVVTGMITTLNPDRFKVDTRMATIGIRGCELGFQAAPEEEKVFVLGLTSKESVVVSSTDDGSEVRDILSGKARGDVETSAVVVKDPGSVVIVSKGLGRTVRPATPGELRKLIMDTNPLKAVKHTTSVQPNSTVFVIEPEKRASGDASQ